MRQAALDISKVIVGIASLQASKLQAALCVSMQDDPAFCGLASVAMVLNALSIDPRRPWKGSWRIFHEHLLDCCVPLAQVQQKGITLSQV